MTGGPDKQLTGYLKGIKVGFGVSENTKLKPIPSIQAAHIKDSSLGVKKKWVCDLAHIDASQSEAFVKGFTLATVKSGIKPSLFKPSVFSALASLTWIQRCFKRGRRFF
jgi:hypothetical protein